MKTSPSLPRSGLRGRAMLASGPLLVRMLAIHAALKEETYSNSQTLARTLGTIQHDIDFMKNRLALPIEYEESRFGFYYDGPVELFPTVQISEGELLALALAKEALRAIRRNKSTRSRGGCLELEIDVNDEYEAIRWILGWGDQARLLAPDSLVVQMREMIGRLTAGYEMSS